MQTDRPVPDQLKLSHQQFLELQQKANTGIFEWDFATNISVGSDQMYEIFGWEKTDSFSDPERFWSMVHPEFVESLKAEMENAIAHEEFFESNYWITNGKNEQKYIHSFGQIIRDMQGKAIAMKGLLIDMTEKKYYELSLEQANEELKKQLKELKLKEGELLEKKKALKDAQSLAKMGSWHWNISDDSVTWSEEMYRMFGYEPYSIHVNYTLWASHLSAETIELFNQKFIQCVADKLPYNLTHTFVDAHGKEKWLQAKGKIIFDKEDKPFQLLGIAIDISEQKETERKLEKRTEELNFLADNALDLISLHNKEGKAIYISPSWETFTGQNPEQMLLNTLEAVMHPDDVGIVGEVFMKVINDEETHHYAARLKHKDGTYKWIEGSVRRFFNNNNKEWEILSSARNVHDRKIAELKLEAHKNELLEVNREMEAFSYSVSHDLRSPLRAIDGFAKILEEEYCQQLNDEGKRLIKIVSSNASYMNSLIENLLDFARLYKRDIKKSNLDVTQILNSVWAKRIENVDKPKYHLQINNMINAPADVGLMELVWGNLICNAVKFTSKKSAPQIIIDALELPHEIQYSIKDNGVGFNDTYYSKLFGIFQKLHLKNEYEGNGVGLAITKRIVVKHGGKIWAESVFGQGATFYFTLPKFQ